MNKSIDLSIIILSWNTKEILKKCLDSIEKESNDINLEIIIVDNNSSDGSSEMVEKNYSKVKLIKNEKNEGFAKGNNIGLKAASGDYVMLLNSDTEVLDSALKNLLNYANTNKNCIVSPLLVLPDGSCQLDYFMKFPNLFQIFLYHNPLIRPIVQKSFLFNLISSKIKAEEKVIEIDQLPGAAILASKEVWKKVGGLDEDYQFFFEDVDWCYRANKLNFKRYVLADAKIVHLGGASWKQRLNSNKNSFYDQFFSSMLLFVRKNYCICRYFIFRLALILNFLITLKPKLFVKFLTKGELQNKTWL